MNGSNTKTIIIIVILIAAAVAAYFGFSGNNEPAFTMIPGEVQGSIAGGDDIAALLVQLNNLKIDNSLFESLEYKVLVDYTIEVPAIPIGRVNPFAPLGSSSRSATTSTPRVPAAGR
ncbi:MAG: hypothetical protein HZA80_00160 [Candidatus Taylorbacteria bacterium]|nr:hypothetical protein [Candidatus Taylorbacteria bacterium]